MFKESNLSLSALHSVTVFYVNTLSSKNFGLNLFEPSLEVFQNQHLSSMALMSKELFNGTVRASLLCVPFTPMGYSEVWDVMKELADVAKVRLYKPADEPSGSKRGETASLLKVVSN